MPSLKAWIDTLLTKHMQQHCWTDQQAHNHRRELAHILSAYPRHLQGELYVAFYACARADCKQCNNEFPFNPHI